MVIHHYPQYIKFKKNVGVFKIYITFAAEIALVQYLQKKFEGTKSPLFYLTVKSDN
jgi:hypothetical protein